MADSRFETDSDSGMDVPQVKKKMIIDSRVKVIFFFKGTLNL